MPDAFEKIEKLFNAWEDNHEALTQSGIKDFQGYLKALRNAATQAGSEALTDPDLEGLKGFDMLAQMNSVELHDALKSLIGEYDDKVRESYVDIAEETMFKGETYGLELGVASNVLPGIRQQMMTQAALNNYDLISNIGEGVQTDINQIFQNAAAMGFGIEDTRQMLMGYNTNGQIPMSPTGRYTPDERIAMIAWNESKRIFNEASKAMANKADLIHVISKINRALRKHSAQCIAAAHAGVMKFQYALERYGDIPRHPQCGCHWLWVKLSWGVDNETDLAYLKEGGIDVEGKANEWNEKQGG